MKHIDKIIKTDLYRYGGLTRIFKGKRNPGFHYMYYLRKASQHQKRSLLGIYYYLILKRLGYKYGFQIPVTTTIGKGFYIGHFGTIVINKDSIIGDYCNIAHCTTIGQTNRGRLEGSPTIGNFVWIGTGCVITGKITIGDNVLIAPNSFVNFDVPANSLVIGNPAKIVSKDNPTDGYINNILST